MSESKLSYSVTIICRNEARTIKEVVTAALDITDDVIVIDSGSTDGSDELAIAAGARVYPYEWKGYGANKNYAASLAKHPWIISIDADEVIDRNLQSAILHLKPKRGTIYQLNSIVQLDGHWIKYSGWHPVWKDRLYHCDDVSWDNAAVHENLYPLSGKRIERLDGLLLHYSYKDLQDHKDRTDHYAQLQAKQWYATGQKPGIIKRIAGPIARWIRTFIIKQGWRDGRIGLYLANSNAKMIRRQIYYYDQLKKTR